MSRIVIMLPDDEIFPINGTLFYLEELGQYIYDNISRDVHVFNTSHINRESLLERYDFIVDEVKNIKKGDIVICSCFNLKYLMAYLGIIKKLFIMNSASSFSFMTTDRFIANPEYLRPCIKYANKFYLLVEEKYKTGTEKFFLFNNRTIDITRGFYFNHYKDKVVNDMNDTWLLYAGGTTPSSIYNDITVNEALSYFKEENISVSMNTDYKTFNPAAIFAGLIYVRFKDYMPRLPYEFWHYNKPVIFFDISEGMLKRFQKEELPLMKNIISTKIPTANYENIRAILK